MKIRRSSDSEKQHQRLLFWCPGCDEPHEIDPARWAVSGPDDSITILPSVLVTGRDEEGENRCHSYVEGGHIRFLPDCSHPLAGSTHPLPDWPESWL